MLFLIISNLLFGWMFFNFKAWLFTEGVLIIILIINSFIITRRVAGVMKQRDNVIDVEGKVVKNEEKKLR